MCFPFDAQPPILAVAGAAIDSEDVVLTAADGTKFAAFAARAEKPRGTGMVVLPDVRGLFAFYEELALRFAEQGINAVTVDYFGRTAGVGKRDAGFQFMPEVLKTHPDTIALDVRAAVAYLQSPAGGSCTSIFTVGFCFGGSNSWNQAAAGHGLRGAIGFYGHPGRVIQQMVNPQATGIPSTMDRVPQITCPIMALQGERTR